VPVLGEAGTETGAWVEARGSGATIESTALEAHLLAFFDSLTGSQWARLQQAAASHPDADFTGESDAAALSRRVEIAAAENRARQSTPDRTYA
jgi:hypothetical protein